MVKRLFLALLLHFYGLFTASIAQASDTKQASDLQSVDELLQKVSKAVQESNYKGRYTYEAGSGLETLEIVHAVNNGVEQERIYHLNGVNREFLRTGRSVECLSTGNFLLRGGLLNVGDKAISLAQNYHFYIRGDERIAGREAAVVQISPKDDYRYGYTLAIDKDSHLPLLLVTTLDNKSVIERFQAVHLKTGDLDLKKDLQGKDSVYSTIDGSNMPCSNPQVADILWRPQWLPTGFVVSHATQAGDMGQSLTYTDGMSSFTVFVNPVASLEYVKRGAARRGATTAFMGAVENPLGLFRVVLIGEVPVKTAQQVAVSVRFN